MTEKREWEPGWNPPTWDQLSREERNEIVRAGRKAMRDYNDLSIAEKVELSEAAEELEYWAQNVGLE